MSSSVGTSTSTPLVPEAFIDDGGAIYVAHEELRVETLQLAQLPDDLIEDDWVEPIVGRHPAQTAPAGCSDESRALQLPKKPPRA